MAVIGKLQMPRSRFSASCWTRTMTNRGSTTSKSWQKCSIHMRNYLIKPLARLSVPADNPFVNTLGAYPYIFSYGHRESMGLTFDATGELWQSEDGPRGGDEVNHINKGHNYGLAAHHLGPCMPNAGSDCLPRGRGHGAAGSQLDAIAGSLRYRILFGQSFSTLAGELLRRQLEAERSVPHHGGRRSRDAARNSAARSAPDTRYRDRTGTDWCTC